jgi:hypothetical protein
MTIGFCTQSVKFNNFRYKQWAICRI